VLAELKFTFIPIRLLHFYLYICYIFFLTKTQNKHIIKARWSIILIIQTWWFWRYSEWSFFHGLLKR